MDDPRFSVRGWGGADAISHTGNAYLDLIDREADAPLQYNVVEEGATVASVVAFPDPSGSGFRVSPVTPLGETPAWTARFVPGVGWRVHVEPGGAE